MLLFRMLMLHVMAEQPAEPDHEPQRASWWRTEDWKRLRECYGLQLITFDQQDGGPTSVATDRESHTPIRQRAGRRSRVQDSKALARWAPGFMHEVARGLLEDVECPEVGPASINKMTWAEPGHIRSRHAPFWRDCSTCQKASAR